MTSRLASRSAQALPVFTRMSGRRSLPSKSPAAQLTRVTDRGGRVSEPCIAGSAAEKEKSKIKRRRQRTHQKKPQAYWLKRWAGLSPWPISFGIISCGLKDPLAPAPGPTSPVSRTNQWLQNRRHPPLLRA